MKKTIFAVLIALGLASAASAKFMTHAPSCWDEENVYPGRYSIQIDRSEMKPQDLMQLIEDISYLDYVEPVGYPSFDEELVFVWLKAVKHNPKHSEAQFRRAVEDDLDRIWKPNVTIQCSPIYRPMHG